MIYLAFHKPNNVLSQFKKIDERKTLLDYIRNGENLKSCGRLDYDSEGLLIVTDDLKFIAKITDPNSNTEKEYYVQVEGSPKPEDLKKIRDGIYPYKPCKTDYLKDFSPWERIPPIRFRKTVPDTWIKMVITEGKNRQVRKMTANAGFPTLRLIRFRIGKLTLTGIEPGTYKQVSKHEIL